MVVDRARGRLLRAAPRVGSLILSLKTGRDTYGIDAYKEPFLDPAFRDSLFFSLLLALETIVISAGDLRADDLLGAPEGAELAR